MRLLPILLLALAASCSSRRDAPSAAVEAPPAIEPGVRAGSVAIGESMDSVLARFGPPTSGDAAMGKVWASWWNRRTHLDVYGVRTPDFSQQLVRQVRSSDSTLFARDRIGIGSPLAEVRRAFPDAQPQATFRRSDLEGEGVLLDDVPGGIAFETWPLDSSAARVVGITVHERGTPVTSAYLPAPGWELMRVRP